MQRSAMRELAFKLVYEIDKILRKGARSKEP